MAKKKPKPTSTSVDTISYDDLRDQWKLLRDEFSRLGRTSLRGCIVDGKVESVRPISDVREDTLVANAMITAGKLLAVSPHLGYPTADGDLDRWFLALRKIAGAEVVEDVFGFESLLADTNQTETVWHFSYIIPDAEAHSRSLINKILTELIASHPLPNPQIPVGTDRDTELRKPPQTALELMASGNHAAVQQIADDATKSIDERMRFIAVAYPGASSWNSAGWAGLLGVSESRIRQQPTWKQIQRNRKVARHQRQTTTRNGDVEPDSPGAWRDDD
jgi:hypothetical protein